MPPIVSVTDKTVFLNNTVSAADLFSASTTEGEIVSYFVQDFGLAQTSGYFEFDGAAIPHGEFFKVNVEDLDKLVYRGGSAVGRERFRIMARGSDGQFSSAGAIGTLFAVRTNDTAPYSRAIPFTVLANEQVAGADVVWGYDPDGFPIETFHIRDRNVDSGYFVFDGMDKTQGDFFSIAASDLDKLVYVATGGNASELFDVIAFDGAENSPQSVGQINVMVNANRPIIQYSRAEVVGSGQIFDLNERITVVDADNSTIKKYRFYNTSPHASRGDLIFKGVAQPRLTWIEVDASELEFLHFRAVNRGATQEIRALVYDGKHWSFPGTLQVTTVFQNPSEKPVFTPNELFFVSEQLQEVLVSDLYSKVDSGGAIESYDIYEANNDPTSGLFKLGSLRLNAREIHSIPASQFDNNLFFKTSPFYNRRIDTIYARAKTANTLGTWEKVDIRTEPEFEDVLVGGSSWTGLLPRDEFGRLQITFSFMQQFPSYGSGGEATDGVPPRHFEIFDGEQRENARLAFRHIEEFLNVQMIEVSDTSTNFFGGTGGIIRMGEYGQDRQDSPAAYAFFPNNSDLGGDMWFNRLTFLGGPFGPEMAFTPGTWGYKVFLHEFGHAMGLKHPHDGTPRLPPETDVNDFSVMSYQQAENGEPTTFQLYDIHTLQDLYGANVDFNSGDTVYSIANTWESNQFIVETIWDGGGNDTLSAVGSSSPAVVDLRSGQQSSIGAVPRNITIALSAEIENGIGSNRSDEMYGNALDNHLSAGDGNDYLLGNSGNDVLMGGNGDDIYEFGIADDSDIIEEGGSDGMDTLRITEFPGMDSLPQDFEFNVNGNDLIVNLNLNEEGSQGRIQIKDQVSLSGSQVESLELNGVRIDLENLTAQVTPTNKRFEVLPTSSANGFLVQPL